MEEENISQRNHSESATENSEVLNNLVDNLGRMASYKRRQSRDNSSRHRNAVPRGNHFSRRDFLKLVSAGILVSSLDYAHKSVISLQETAETLLGATENKKSGSNREILTDDKLDQLALIDPKLERYEDSLIYAGLNILVSEAISKIALKYNIPVGNLSTGKYGVNFPDISAENASNLYGKLGDNVGDYLIDTFLTPLAEELLFRYFLPKVFINKDDKDIRWDIGLATSYVFGYGHNLAAPEDIDLDLIKQVIPVHQIGLGLVCYYLSRQAGFSKAYVAHIANNALLAPIFNKVESYITHSSNNSIEKKRPN